VKPENEDELQLNLVRAKNPDYKVKEIKIPFRKFSDHNY